MSSGWPSGGGGGGPSDRQIIAAELNRRNHLGLTVLHLAVVEDDPWALDWVELLLSTPGLQVNATDAESGWSALHRALYAGNIPAARLLLQRDDTDTRLKDREGLTPFDVYNSTVDGTNPLSSSPLSTHPLNPGRIELLSWGSNRNYTLGFASDSERHTPERVALRREEGARGLAAFEPLRVKDVNMARLHTAIVTDEKSNNIRLCGYGTGGRLGPTNQTQFTFAPLRDFPQQVSSVVLSPDHTVVITTAGDVYTFGLNRFSQLGYTLDTLGPSPFSKSNEDDPIQATPRRVVGALKKEVVIGAAASRTHTVVFTADSLFAWGTNRGQLGFPIAGNPVQVLPRKVTLGITQPVRQLTATENATACLLESRDVVVLYHEAYVKVAFPLDPFPRHMMAFRPTATDAKPSISKLAACGNTFAALSSLGDVFTFQLDSGTASAMPTSSSTSSSSTGAAAAFAGTSGDGTASPGRGARFAPKPTRIWTLRRSFTSVTDVGVGIDGTIIICTVSGHVFIRSRKFDSTSAKSGLSLSLGLDSSSSPSGSSSSAAGSGERKGGWKFSRVPYLQRVIKVAANSTGGFAALRADVPLRFIDLDGPSLAVDLLALLPHWERVGPPPPPPARPQRPQQDDDDDDDDDDTDAVIERDIAVATKLMEVLRRWDLTWETSENGTDAVINVGVRSIPVHKTVLAARSPVLARHFATHRQLELECSGLAALLVVHYLYSDDFPAVWDSRVGLPLRKALSQAESNQLDVGAVKLELRTLAKALELDALSQALERQVKTVPAPTLASSFTDLLAASVSPKVASTLPASLKPDVVLRLADREVRAHSVVLRARCAFFATFFADPDWHRARRSSSGVVTFDFSHLEWDVVSLVLEHVYRDAGMSLFQAVERDSADEYVDFAVRVLAAANELLLDKLKQVCSAVLRSFVTLHNVCSILCDAAFYEAHDLSRACMHFLASSMETALETYLLDDLPHDLLRALTAFVRERQGAKMPVSRSNLLFQELLPRHQEFYDSLDVGRPTGAAKRYRPATVPPSPRPSPSMLSPGTSPQLAPTKSPRMRPSVGPSASPNLSPSLPAASFMPLGSPPPMRLQPWQAAVVEPAAPLDLRSIMASESAATPPRRASAGPSGAKPPSSAPSGLTTSSPSWRPVVPQRTSSLASIQEQQQALLARRPSAQPVPSASGSTSVRSPPPAAPPTPSRLASTAPVAASPGVPLGPVFTPSRLPSGSKASPSPRTPFGGSDTPWQNYDRMAPSPTPPPAPVAVVASSPTDPFARPTASSFAAIQSEQRAQVAAVNAHKAKRSLAEVMAQEQADALRREQELKEEKEFLSWFEEESKRVKQEQLAAAKALPFTPGASAPSSGTSTPKRSGGGGGAAGGRGGGGGRGKGKGRGGGAAGGHGVTSPPPPRVSV
ncbi:uncharacterized protein RHOBADRAFT_37206 [Rhodotorula graminis WP1]|uniref:BTB domain-containing protein n=1 Tax=Rhodotorula graminis (strain WP1) TaxID=578459 RepID=A0A194S0H6_RHOGW|nr:uncharacterized protein RHOBADRAFT_37206 [Rhodotorula graminis WP1]KPV74228.1 hypothetical protein RHOBADRAFT_37206 [Rhodotorula graminis WP1]